MSMEFRQAVEFPRQSVPTGFFVTIIYLEQVLQGHPKQGHMRPGILGFLAQFSRP
jgi:hypothetical protein